MKCDCGAVAINTPIHYKWCSTNEIVLPTLATTSAFDDFLYKASRPNNHTLVYVTKDTNKLNYKSQLFNTYSSTFAVILEEQEAFTFLDNILPTELYIENNLKDGGAIMNKASGHMGKTGKIHVVNH